MLKKRIVAAFLVLLGLAALLLSAWVLVAGPTTVGRILRHGTTRIDDYAKYPLETIAEGGGDCEDHAILAATLLSAAGEDAAVINIPATGSNDGHVFAAVRVRDSDGLSVIRLGRQVYAMIETTTPCAIGKISAEWLDRFDWDRATAATIPATK